LDKKQRVEVGFRRNVFQKPIRVSETTHFVREIKNNNGGL
jgi:hypothetical protein